MDSYEATKVVFSRIQGLDPENASKIMGFILIQDQGEKEMIRLAFGPETLLLSLISKAKSCFGLSSNTSSTNASPIPTPRIIIPTSHTNNGFHHINHPSSPSSPWFSDHRSPSAHVSPRPSPSLSYAAVVNGGGNGGGGSGSFSSSSPNGSFQAPFGDLQDEYGSLPIQDQLSFFDGSAMSGGEFMDPVMSPSGRSDSVLFPYGSGGAASWADSEETHHHHHHLHRRSFSVSDAFLGGGGGSLEDGGNGFGWRPCMYFARGFCKNGNACKFSHGGFADSGDVSAASIVGSPGKFDGVDELLKMKAIQQQRFAASQLMAGAPFPYNKCMNLLSDTQRSAAAALMMGDEFHKFGRCRSERNGFSDMGFCGNANSSSRQIYLTFPADSTFKEEDVSNYFSLYGPVQDVRIPYQQKRMFGFVTFVYAETVKIILAKGNPHFVCDSRVLVKPYKEKGKIPDKKQQGQQLERGDYGACLSPSGLDSREPFDIPVGARMFYNTQEMLRRKLEEQAELQHAIDLQGRRMMNLQLMDLKNHPQFHPIPSPTQSHTHISQGLVIHSNVANEETPEENNGPPDGDNSPTVAANQKLPQEVNEVCNNSNSSGNEESPNLEDTGLPESFEHILPDNLFASPTKSAGDHHNSIFSIASTELEDSSAVTTTSSNNGPNMLPTTSTLNITSLQSCYFQMPRKE